MNLPDVPIVVLDTETTGFVPKVHRIIEFASVQIQSGKTCDEYECLISIPGEIPPQISALTHIYEKDVEGKPVFEDLREEILSHIGQDTLIVGQNVGFDIRMLKGEGIDLTDRPWIDTSMIASLVFPEFESYSLGYMSKVLNLNHAPVHRALGDVNATIELLSKCWDRLLELPPELADPFLSIMNRSTPGYKKIFSALPASTTVETPAWLSMPQKHVETSDSAHAVQITPREKETVQLVEEPVEPGFLQQVLNGLPSDSNHCIAVKNLRTSLPHITLSDDIAVVHPASYLLDESAVAPLANQEVYTADEATLATKLAWYQPDTYNDLPIHGDEKSIWYGKIACTEQSDAYKKQFENLPNKVLINHWQLLRMISQGDHPCLAALDALSPHILIDDASMLEDTATKAYGWKCDIDSLRAAAEGSLDLTKFTDLLQIWIERIRNGQDTYYLTAPQLSAPDCMGLKKQLADIIESLQSEESNSVAPQLEELLKILDPANVQNRIVYIEQMQNGSQILESVPERVGESLHRWLYNQYSTTLLIPPNSADSLDEILPKGTHKSIVQDANKSFLQLSFEPDEKLDTFLQEPLPGKTIALVSSRKRIEDIFIKYAADMDKRDITLICQGWNGGMGRMQAEYVAAEGDTIMVMTPWQFEGLEFPVPQIDHLLIDTLPFDHPNHTIISRRANHYQNAFGSYSLPRLLHRLYRVVRTFRKYSTEDADVIMLDARIETKRYGGDVLKYLKRLVRENIDSGEQKPNSKNQIPSDKSNENLESEKNQNPETNDSSSSDAGKLEPSKELPAFTTKRVDGKKPDNTEFPEGWQLNLF